MATEAEVRALYAVGPCFSRYIVLPTGWLIKNVPNFGVEPENTSVEINQTKYILSVNKHVLTCLHKFTLSCRSLTKILSKVVRHVDTCRKTIKVMLLAALTIVQLKIC